MAWHPHCLSLVDNDGDRVAVEVMPRREWAGSGLVRYCHWVDTTVIINPDADPLPAWVCPSCGGTEYELVEEPNS